MLGLRKTAGRLWYGKKQGKMENCGTQYKEKQKATECEKSHGVVARVKDARYHSMGAKPGRVEVVFSDGSTAWYKA